jgi:hypothetical protein
VAFASSASFIPTLGELPDYPNHVHSANRNRLPEPRGRSFAELDMLFEKGVSARKFASTKIDVFEGTRVEDTTAFRRYEGGGEHGGAVAREKGAMDENVKI